jgi:predicted DNA-binding transcriptional regulator YafY
MRRADRLFKIIQFMRRRRVVTAARLAEELDVSVRTIYRDVEDLILSGTPIDGEAGVGYSLRPGYDLPPLMFDAAELEALVAGARFVASFGDEELARASRSAIGKVESVLPPRLKPLLGTTKLFAPSAALARQNTATLVPIREAISTKRKLELDYARTDGEPSQRVVRPLGAFFWGKTWTLTAWCELRDDFRTFRLDRIQKIHVLAQTFEEESGRTLRDYLNRYGPDAVGMLGG